MRMRVTRGLLLSRGEDEFALHSGREDDLRISYKYLKRQVIYRVLTKLSMISMLASVVSGGEEMSKLRTNAATAIRSII